VIVSRHVWEEIGCETRDERELAGADGAEHVAQLVERAEHVAQLAKLAYGGDVQHLLVGGVERLEISPLLVQFLLVPLLSLGVVLRQNELLVLVLFFWRRLVLLYA